MRKRIPIQVLLLAFLSLGSFCLKAQENPAVSQPPAGKGVTPVAAPLADRPSSGHERPMPSVTRAVVIGISDYQDGGIPDLNYAHKDAQAFTNWLRAPGGGGVLQDNIMLLLNEAATMGEVSSALTWLLDESKEGDQAIIYFSGHGDMEAKILNQLGFLLLWDSPAKSYIAGALSVDMLKQVVTSLSVEQKANVLVVADACRAGKLAGNNIIGAQLTNTNLVTQFSNEQKILSCQADEYSAEGKQWGGGRGAFSWHLINGLSGLADQNGDKEISLLEIEQYLQDRVPPEVEPLSQIPLAVGDKNKQISHAHDALLAGLQSGDGLAAASFSRVEQRGMEKDVLAKADSSIIRLFLAFQKALGEKRLLEPVDDCAEAYYEKLIQIESIKPLHKYLQRNLAATFQEDAQQAINAYLNADQEELNRLSRWDDKYRLYPLYLQKAAELLGPESHFHTSLVARQKYFEGLYLRLFFDVVNMDSLFRAAVQKLNESLELEPNAAYVYQELGLLYDRRLEKDTAVSYFLQAIERSPAWLLPYMELQEIYRYIGWPADWYERFKNAFPSLESKAGPRQYLVYAMRAVSAWTHAHESPASVNLNGDQRKALEKEAEQLINTGMEMEGAADWLWYYWGHKLGLQGRFAEAEALLENALARFPDDGKSYWELSLPKFGMGKIEEGVALYDKGLHMNPYRAHDYLRFCDILQEHKRPEKAFEVLERLFQLDPDYHFKLSNGSAVGRAAGMFDHLGKGEIARQFRDLEYSNATGQIRTWLSRNPQWETDPEARKQLVDLVKKLDLTPHQLWETGTQLYQEKHPQQAESLFKLALELHPNDLGLLNYIGAYYLIHGDFDRSEKYFKHGLSMGTDAWFFGNLAHVYLLKGDYEKTRETLKAARTAFPADPFYYVMEALTNYLLNSAANSKWLFEEVAKMRPDFMNVWEFLENMRKGEYAEAVCYWDKIDESSHDIFLVLLHYYIAALTELKDYKAAYDALVSADKFGGFVYTVLASHPVLESFRQTQEYQRYMLERYPEKFDDKTLEAFRASLDTSTVSFPYQANYNRLMGLYHRYHKRHDEAIQYFLKSLGTAPDNDAAKIYLADLYQKTGRYKEANSIAPKQLKSDGLEVHWVAGTVYYHLNQHEKAERHFKEFVKQANDNRYPNNRVGAFYRIHGEFALAETFLREDLRLHPDDKTFPPSDCRCETNLLKKDIRLHPTNLTARLNLALLYFFSNEKEKCYGLLAESIRREPGQLSLQALLAFLHYFDNPAEAKPYFSKANALAPGFYQLWAELELMRTSQFEQADRAWQNAAARFTDWWIEIVKYRYMLMKIRQGDTKRAFELLDELLDKEVFVNYQFYQTDTGLAPLRKMPRFKELMQRYFPGKNVK